MCVMVTLGMHDGMMEVREMTELVVTFCYIIFQNNNLMLLNDFTFFMWKKRI